MKKFGNKQAEKLFKAERVKGVPTDVAQRAHNKLRIVARIDSLRDLEMFPGMKLESLKGNRKGQHSVRVNDQWRICFVWNGHETEQIEFVDYH
jgi:proteic killer suppression protein